MKLKQLTIALSFSILTQATFAADLACQKDYESIISKNIIAISTAFNSRNFQYIENKTDSSLINYAGGQSAFRNLLEITANNFKKSNIVVSKVETQPPVDNYIVGNNEICFIPEKLTLMVNGQEHISESFMLAIRPLISKKWKYLDGAGFKKHPNMLYILFPDFPRDIKVSFLENQ
ncbi:hypothetical protein [Acinetobacter sp. MD2]|uniref:hypothetical protein n=1 Tax=Acinetobacter sp. MD2 TaxID=2600066 RepID=UPI002D1E4ECF|nr:hypothetical protein [Acinetobacter sp. MD2]MEB3768311.1 hypothetical protein [Acinetobacter sp. MD2]